MAEQHQANSQEDDADLGVNPFSPEQVHKLLAIIDKDEQPQASSAARSLKFTMTPMKNTTVTSAVSEQVKSFFKIDNPLRDPQRFTYIEDQDLVFIPHNDILPLLAGAQFLIPDTITKFDDAAKSVRKELSRPNHHFEDLKKKWETIVVDKMDIDPLKVINFFEEIETKISGMVINMSKEDLLVMFWTKFVINPPYLKDILWSNQKIRGKPVNLQIWIALNRVVLQGVVSFIEMVHKKRQLLNAKLITIKFEDLDTFQRKLIEEIQPVMKINAWCGEIDHQTHLKMLNMLPMNIRSHESFNNERAKTNFLGLLACISNYKHAMEVAKIGTEAQSYITVMETGGDDNAPRRNQQAGNYVGDNKKFNKYKGNKNRAASSDKQQPSDQGGKKEFHSKYQKKHPGQFNKPNKGSKTFGKNNGCNRNDDKDHEETYGEKPEKMIYCACADGTKIKIPVHIVNKHGEYVGEIQESAKEVVKDALTYKHRRKFKRNQNHKQGKINSIRIVRLAGELKDDGKGHMDEENDEEDSSPIQPTRRK